MSRPRPSQYPLIHDSFLWVVSRCLSVSFLSRDKILYYLIVWINNLSISLATSPPRTSRHQRVFFRFFLVERTIIHSVRHRHCIPPGVIWTFVVSHSVSRMQRWNVSQIFSKSFIFSCILRSSSSYSSSRLLWNHSVLTHHRPSSFWKLDRLLTSFSWSLFPYDDFIWRSWSEFLSTCQCTFSRPWFFGVLKYIWTSSNDNKTPTQLYIRFLTRKWVRGGGGKDKVQNTFTITTRNSKKNLLKRSPSIRSQNEKYDLDVRLDAWDVVRRRLQHWWHVFWHCKLVWMFFLSSLNWFGIFFQRTTELHWIALMMMW